MRRALPDFARAGDEASAQRAHPAHRVALRGRGIGWPHVTTRETPAPVLRVWAALSAGS
jgi:hypothetical protein